MERFHRASEADRPRAAADLSPGVATPTPESASEVVAHIEQLGHTVASRECEQAHQRLEDPTPAQRVAVEMLAHSLATRLFAPAASSVERAEDETVVDDAGRLFDGPIPGPTDD